MRHSGPIAALSQAGPEYLATGGYDGAVGLFDVARRRYITHHALHTDLVSCVSATGKTIISGGADGCLGVVKIDGDVLRPVGLVPFDDDVEAVVALDDMTYLVGLGNGDVHRVELLAGDNFQSRVAWQQVGTVTALRLVSDGRIVSTGNDGRLRVAEFGPEGVAVVTVLHCSELPLKNAIVVAHTGMAIAGGHDGVLTALHVDGHAEPVEVHRFPSSVRGLAAGHGELFAGSYNGEILRFSLADLHLLGPASVASTAGEVWTRQLVAAADGTVFAASMNGLPIPVETCTVQATSNINCVAASGDARAIVGTDSGDVLTVEYARGQLVLAHVSGVGECITSIAVGADGTIATCTWSGGLFVDGIPVARLGQPLLGLDWVGTDLAVGTYRGDVVRVAPDGRIVASVAALPSSTKRIVAHGERVFVVGRYGPAAVIDQASWAVTGTIQIATRVCDALAISPSGDLLAIAAGTNNIWLFVLEDVVLEDDPQPKRRLGGHTKAPKDIAWADDATLFSTGYDSTVVRHDLATATSSVRDLGAVAHTGICGLAVINRSTVLATAFDGQIREIRFDD